MIIGINASSALKENPTGVEEYVFQLVKHLAVIPESRAHRFVLYLNPQLKSFRFREFEKLPDNFTLKFLGFPNSRTKVRFLWTQGRLAWEMLFAKIDVLFIPVHVLPMIHPKKTVVTIHGLEYELFPELYPALTRYYIRFVTRYALSNSAKIIAVSENTKKDLAKLYGGRADKISVIHHGMDKNFACRQEGHESRKDKHILYIGRLELKKNVSGIIGSYDLLRKKNPQISNKLILAGGKGFGFEKIIKAVEASPFKKDIILKGYVSEPEKQNLLRNAAVFLFPSFYEGFGLPVLEAQAAGIPVIVSNTSCLPEIAGAGAMLVDPNNAFEIAGALEKILSSEELRQYLVSVGFKNIERFSWDKCARETLKALTEGV